MSGSNGNTWCLDETAGFRSEKCMEYRVDGRLSRKIEFVGDCTDVEGDLSGGTGHVV